MSRSRGVRDWNYRSFSCTVKPLIFGPYNDGMAKYLATLNTRPMGPPNINMPLTDRENTKDRLTLVDIQKTLESLQKNFLHGDSQ